jgi:hypothetical protein
MAMEGKMNEGESRVGEFLEKMTKSHAGGIEKIACKVGQMQADMEEKMRRFGRKFWKSKLRRRNRLLTRIRGCEVSLPRKFWKSNLRPETDN